MAGFFRKRDAQQRVEPVFGKKSRAPAGAGAKRSGRRPAQGATRNPNPAAEKTTARSSSVWFNRLLILVGAGVVLVAATKAFITVQSLPVQRISVTGELEHTQAQAVQDMVQPGLAGGFLNADLQQIRRQLEGLPWIYEATVRRKWPNALEIHVVEELPIARWGQDGFLNHEGGVFRSDKDGDWDSLPLLSGPDGSAQSLMEKYLRLVEILTPLNLSVQQLAVDERGQMEAVLAGGIQLNLGSENFLGRMHRFVAIYRNELSVRSSEVERVDLRYESGVAVAFKAPEQQEEPSRVAGL
ncbi:MAG: cell division protein FtsQ/DivIB [Halioglobus sp.]